MDLRGQSQIQARSRLRDTRVSGGATKSNCDFGVRLPTRLVVVCDLVSSRKKQDTPSKKAKFGESLPQKKCF